VNRRSEYAAALYDDLSTRPAVVATIERCGFSVAVLDGPAGELVAEARELTMDLLVFDLASAGNRGLNLVRDMRVALPGCAIVVLAPFEGLRAAALAAGAHALIGRDDLRDLSACLRALAAQLDARVPAESGPTGPLVHDRMT
jgi:ActR/RegA family two-component response regulator